MSIGTVLSGIVHSTGTDPVGENIFVGRIPRTKLGLFDYKKLYEDTEKLFQKYEIEDIDPRAKAGSLSLSQKQICRRS